MLKKSLCFLWKAISLISRYIILFVGSVVILTFAYFLWKAHSLAKNNDEPKTKIIKLKEEQGALIIDLNRGYDFLEQTGQSHNAFYKYFGLSQGSTNTTIDTAIKAIKIAAKDDKISGLYLDLSAGHVFGNIIKDSLLQESILEFKKAGKPIIAYSPGGYDFSEYYTVRNADKIYTGQYGVELDGLTANAIFQGDLKERYGIESYAVSSSKYDLDIIPRHASHITEEFKVNADVLTNQTYKVYAENLAKARKLPVETFYWDSEKFISKVRKTEVASTLYVREKILDGAVDLYEFPETILAKAFGKEEKSKKFKGIALDEYIKTIKPEEKADKEKDHIARFYLIGGFGSNTHHSFNVGTVTSALDGIAKKPEHVKGVIIYLDNSGGSYNDGRKIYDAIEGVKKAGVPVVVQVSRNATGVGYLIAAAANKIAVYPESILGHISAARVGTYSIYEPLKNVGINVDGAEWTNIRETDFSLPEYIPFFGSSFDQTKFSPERKAFYQTQVDNVYNIFKKAVVEARKLTPVQIENAAQGQILMGQNAIANNLADILTTSSDTAVNALKELIKDKDKKVNLNKLTLINYQTVSSAGNFGVYAKIKDLIVKSLGLTSLELAEIDRLAQLTASYNDITSVCSLCETTQKGVK